MNSWSPRLPRHQRLRAWLRGEGSLTARLRAGVGALEVRRLFEGRERPARDELARLGGARRFRAYVREVELWGGGRPLVWARTVLCARQARAAWRAVRGLGDRPLAELLFGARPLPRSAMDYARLPAGRAALRRCRRDEGAPGRVWGRRSVFWRRGVPLLLTECFLPAVCRLDPEAAAVPRRPAGGRAPQRGRPSPASSSSRRIS